VERSDGGTAVRIKTSGPVKYAASLIDTPARLIIDFSGTIYAWPKTRMATDLTPIKEIRGSQWRAGVARVVVEMTRKAAYRIDQDADGLVVMIEPSATAPSEAKTAEGSPDAATATAPAKKSLAAADSAKATAPPTVTPTPEGLPLAPIAGAGRKSEKPEPQELVTPDPKKAPGRAVAGKSRGAEKSPTAAQSLVAAKSPVEEPTPVAEKTAAETSPVTVDKPAVLAAETAKSTLKGEAPVVKLDGSMAAVAPPFSVASKAPPPLPVPVMIGQAQTTTSNGSKTLSLDFKDADVVNLLRILAAESGRNIVAGDDVKGKVSISLRNVTWEQALDIILEVRGLAKIEKGGVIRVVSLDQLTKEREAQARVEEAKRRAEIETRTKLAEAELKEAEVAAKRAQAEAAIAEAQARGPLREETIRLSYADPEEVARTLQGILGIPPEGTQPVSSTIPAVPPLIAEPPFSQLYGQAQSQRQPPALVSVSQDVLAKGITIKAHKPTNTIFIRHYATDLERIKRLVREQLDVPLPQVKIEARMEILDRNALEAIGIQWGGAAAGNAGNLALVGQGLQSQQVRGQVIPQIGGVLAPDGTTILSNPLPAQGFSATQKSLSLANLLPVDALTGLPMGGNLVNLPFQFLPNAASQIPAGGIAFGIIGTRFNINLALQALASQGKTRTLARPEIVTVENSKASISLGEEIPYATVSSAGTQIQFKEALLKLDVTPTVIREVVAQQEVRKIKMVVVMENNSRGDTVNLGAGGTPPAINRRKAETQVLINEGERLVIGGVTQGVTQSTVRKVPVLGDIPLLGWLFKQKETFETGRELVVFVTPSILRPGGLAAVPSR